MANVEIKNLSYYYPGAGKKVLSGINLKIEEGEILFIAGESGSGKSTLARCIAGSIPNFYGGTISGDIMIGGRSIKDMSHKERAGEVTMVFQDPERQLVMDEVHREVAFGLQNIGVEEENIKRRVWEALQFSNILDLAYRDINTLSGGQKQKVAVASALSYLPGCIVLDEPTSQLDPSSTEEVIALVRKINRELGVSIIVIEQRINKWIDIADKIALLKAGSLCFSGTVNEMYESEDKYVLGFLPSCLRLSKTLGISEMPADFKDNRQKLDSFVFAGEREKTDNKDKEIIDIKKLYCSFDRVDALKDVGLKIREGEFTGVLGANGAGKSTLLKSIMCLVKYNGSIRVMGNDIKKMKLKDLARICGYVSQNPNDYISKDTVYDELKFTLDNHGLKDDGVIDETLKALDIYVLKDKNPRDISGGERQRVAIASIMVLKPRILLLDEPTRGLDSGVKEMLGKALQRLNADGTTIMLITHDVEFAAEYCSRFVLMFNGEIAADGSREKVLSDGIYYTTEINKLLRKKNKYIFTLNQALQAAR